MTSAIVNVNLADTATVTASSWLIETPPSRLQNAHTERRWQGENGATEFILATWSTAQSINVIELLKCAKLVAGVETVMTSLATVRVRVSSVDLTGVAGDLYDSSSGLMIDEDYESLAVFLTNPVSAKAVRIDLTEVGAEALMAGRLIIGRMHVFEISFMYGWSYGYNDLSRITQSAGGQTFVDREKPYRILSVSYEMLTMADRFDFVMDIDRLNALSGDVLFITDVSTTNASRDSVWGLIQDMSPPTQPLLEYFTKNYTIAERK